MVPPIIAEANPVGACYVSDNKMGTYRFGRIDTVSEGGSPGAWFSSRPPLSAATNPRLSVPFQNFAPFLTGSGLYQTSGYTCRCSVGG